MEENFDTSYVVAHIADGLRWNLLNQDKLDFGFMMEEIYKIIVQNTDDHIQIAEIEMYYG